jgi:putative DNA primase/helicase
MSRLSASTVKAAVSPASYYRSELPDMPSPKPGRAGWVDGGLCPFHADTRRGNFRLNLQTGAYCCFACGAKGDLIRFHMARHGLSLTEALNDLGRRYLLGVAHG